MRSICKHVTALLMTGLQNYDSLIHPVGCTQAERPPQLHVTLQATHSATVAACLSFKKEKAPSFAVSACVALSNNQSIGANICLVNGKHVKSGTFH